MRRSAEVAARTASRTAQATEAAPGFNRGAKSSLAQLQDAALTLQHSLRNTRSPPAAADCNHTLQGLCLAGARWSGIRQLYTDVRQANVEVWRQTMELLIPAAIQASQATDALELVSRLQDAHGRAPLRLMCSFISHLLRVRSNVRGTACRAAAYQLWCELRASGVKLDVAAGRAGINACVETGRLAEAEQVLAAMRRAGLQPGHGAYNMIMKFHTRRGDMDAARRVFLQIRAAREADERPGAPPISSYNTLMAGFVRAGDLTMARATLDKAVRDGAQPDAYSYSTLVHGLADAGLVGEAEQALEEMVHALAGGSSSSSSRASGEEAGVNGNGNGNGAHSGWPASTPPQQQLQQQQHVPWLPVHPFCSVAEAMVRVCDWRGAERVLRRMRGLGLRPTIALYNALIKGRCYALEPGAAQALVEEMRAQGLRPDATTYSTLLHSAARLGDLDGAMGVLGAMRLEGVPPDAVVFTSLMKAFRLAGQHERAVDCFRQLAGSRSSAVDVMALNCLVAVHASAGQMAEADAAACHADDLAAELRLPPPPEAAYALIQGYAMMAAAHTRGRATAGGGATAAHAAGPAPGPAISSASDAEGDTSGGGGGYAAPAVPPAPQAQAPILPPPPHLLRGPLHAALFAFRRFLSRGGRPHRKMADLVYKLCLRHYDFRAAAQVRRALTLLRVDVRQERLDQWLAEAQQRVRTRRQGDGGTDSGDELEYAADSGSGRPTAGQVAAAEAVLSGPADVRGGREFGSGAGAAATSPQVGRDLEKIKWWFGLPNNYYDSDWRRK